VEPTQVVPHAVEEQAHVISFLVLELQVMLAVAMVSVKIVKK
jgi:hypothetical protein